MNKVLAFSGSNSSKSINTALVKYTLALLKKDSEQINLTNFEFPMFSVDLESEIGQPHGVEDLLQYIKQTNKIIISTPEHNSSIPAFFKNILDWLSRSGDKYLSGKDILLMSTSTGKGGAKKAQQYAENQLKHAGGNIIAQFSLPSFNENFDKNNGSVSNRELNEQLLKAVQQLTAV